MKLRAVFSVAALAAALVGCDDPAAILQPGAEVPRPSAQSVAPGDSLARKGTWVRASADSLWSYIVQADTTVTVGVKEPGSRRGMIEGKRVVPDAAWQGALRALRNDPEMRVIEVSEYLPMVRVKPLTPAALARLQRWPFSDYVEPAVYLNPHYLKGGSSLGFGGPSLMSSCGTSDGSSSSPIYGARPLAGDSVPLVFDAMAIPSAWLRSTGSGVTVSLIDTGIDVFQPELAGITPFDVENRVITGQDDNSHGTHQMGALAAPRNGANTVGVAYGARAISVRHGDGYVSVDMWRINRALDISVREQGARVVNMALRADNWFDGVSDNIYFLHDNHDVVLVAAAGTTCPYGYIWGVAFPAEHPRVIAVTGLDLNTKRKIPESWAGPEVALSAPVGHSTTGHYSVDGGAWGTTGGASNASTLVSGIATLIRSRYPGMRNFEVRDRMIWAATDVVNEDSGTGWDSFTGHGYPNAMKALGGLYDVNMAGCFNDRCEFSYKISQCITKTYGAVHYGGDGPITYQWSTGGTGTTTTMRLCPSAGRIEYYAVSLIVRDASDGQSIYRRARISVMSSNPDEACPTCPV